jgi:predicted short-subunit dehydrogenase-like oxidoreductase (DUF2520 family)
MPYESHRIAIIGTGHVAHVLGRVLKRSGNRLTMVVGRTAEKAERLAFELGCKWSTKMDDIPEDTEVILMAVTDDAIVEVASELYRPGTVVAHTSGSIPMEALGDCSDRLGVFYPLQTLHRDAVVDFRQVPLCIEGNGNWNEGLLMEVARSISDNVQIINSEQRKMVHLAAVFACNFSNHCYAMADDILSANGVSLDILRPLVRQTAENIRHRRPAEVQTGPARRGDTQVMAAHLELLEKFGPELTAIYELMSNGIAKNNPNMT